MYRIKKIEKNGGIYIVRVSGEGDDAGFEEKCLVAKEFFLPLGLTEGELTDEDGARSLLSAADLTAAVSKALDVLSYSNVSRRALVEKLRFKHKIGKETAELAADYAVGRGYLDEESQAKKIAESAVRSKMWGRRRVASDLYSKGYSKETAQNASSQIPDEDYREALDRLISKKVKAVPKDSAEYNRIISSLIRLGHSPSDIREALEESFGEEE